MKNTQQLLTKKEFAQKAMISQRSAERLAATLIEENKDTEDVKKDKNGSLWLHPSLLNRYVDEAYLNLEKENQDLERENQGLKKLIDLMCDGNHLGSKLCRYPWSYFGHIAYKDTLPKPKCRENMDGLYNSLVQKYGVNGHVRFFYTTEDVFGRGNNHNHFVLYLTNPSKLEEVKKEIESFIPNSHRIHLDKYDKYKPGLYYICKEGLNHDYWDLLGTDWSRASILKTETADS